MTEILIPLSPVSVEIADDAEEQRAPRKGRSSARGAILAATEALMVEEGYAAVTTRRVAKIVGVTPALIHYHFATTDDLLLALFRSTKDGFREQLAASLAGDDPLTLLWRLNSEPERARLVIEFMALSNHRKAIAAEMAEYIVEVRQIQAAALARVLPAGPNVAPMAAAVLVAGMARSLVMEDLLGVSLGHDEVQELVERMIRFARGEG
ncbi:TetR/AcrR family transcriptional regulator [Sphingobium sufflavum]|uniref:TetR/AcrR family transcriptional regulator n=1 Tax=Sphingobium sufflavum TaxID=1129547 RepID=UPI002278A449|nr:TetR/AcrR family transcriptional regulator [Sphingobium sufflavum]